MREEALTHYMEKQKPAYEHPSTDLLEKIKWNAIRKIVHLDFSNTVYAPSECECDGLCLQVLAAARPVAQARMLQRIHGNGYAV